jgi:hypothetical protein
MVRECIPIPQKTYNIIKRLKTSEEVEKYFLGLMAFIDCTEQQVPRSVDKDRRKMYYSGKKNVHTVKNQLLVNNRDYILHKTADHKKGRKHDYEVYKKNHPIVPKQVVNVPDLGYLGVEKDYPEQLSSALPFKRKRNQDLSQEEIDYAKIHSKKR